MQKGYKREAKGMAILRCFFGLFVVIIVVLLASFMLKLDYSDKLAPDASVRPYVETTPAPSLSPDDEQPAALADLSTGTPEPETTATPTPKPTATPTPKPTATPEPTAVPTSIPESAFAPIRTDLTFPETPTTDKAVLGVTHSYRSEADNLSVMQLQGYAYIDDAAFDGSTAQLYLVLKRESNGARAVALTTMKSGVSGVDHTGAQCANASACDFEIFLSTASLPDDIYSLGMVIQYKVGGADKFEYVEFPETCTFTVLNRQFLGDVALTD